jgi:phosphatidylserine decarboxylase
MAMNLKDSFLPPMHPEGRRFMAIFALVTLGLFFLWPVLGWIGLCLTIWCYYFFRDPVRSVPQGEGLVLSPADGVVSLIEQVAPPEGLAMDPAPLWRVSIFMSVFNCHVNRAVTVAKVGAIVYHPGAFFSASLDKASAENERNSVRFDLADGRQIAVVQIAGLVARRIMCWVKPADALRAGERFGLIRFGSRLDVYLPPGVAPMVTLGQTTVAGETVIADLASKAPAATARRD